MVFITPIIISNLSFLGLRLPISFDQFDIIKVFTQRVLALVALSAWSWEMLVKGGRIRRTPVDWLILAFLGWVALSAIFSIHLPTALFGKYRRFEGWFSFLTYAVIYFLVLQLADKPKRIHRLAQTIFFSGLLVAAYGILQALGGDILQWGQLPFEANRSFSTYGNPDLLAGFLMFGTMVSLGLAISESNLVWRGVYWLGFLMNSMVVVTAFARSAWVASVPAIAIFVLLAVRQKAPWKFEDWVFSVVAGSGVAAFIVRSLSSETAVMNFAKRVVSIFEFDQGSAKTRFQIWEAAWNAVMDRPIFGFGPDTFRLIFPRYKPVEYVKDAGYLSVADNVHNYPLQLSAGIGIPGMLMFYSIMAWAAARSFKVIWNRDRRFTADRMVLVGLWAACAGYIVHLIFGLSVTGTSFLLWVCMAAVLSPTATSFEFKPPSWGVAPAALLVALALAGVVFHVTYLRADHAYLLARIASQGTERTANAQRAVELNPWNDMYRAEVGLALTDETLSAINALASSQGDQQQAFTTAMDAFKRAEASLLETIEFVPWEYDNYVFLANLYNLAGQFFDPSYFRKAEEMGLKGIEVEEFGPAIRLQYARTLVALEREDEAIEQLEIAVGMDPAYVDAVTMLASIYESRGEITEAIRVLRATEELTPGKPGVTDKLQELESNPATTP
jgi:O-antigen ligase